jgi:hypothetical protein
MNSKKAVKLDPTKPDYKNKEAISRKIASYYSRKWKNYISKLFHFKNSDQFYLSIDPKTRFIKSFKAVFLSLPSFTIL